MSRFDPKAREEVSNSELESLEKFRSADFYFLKGEQHRINDEIRQAISFYEMALEIDPEHEDSLFFAGYCCVLEAEQDTNAKLESDKALKAKRAIDVFEKLIGVRERKKSICWDDYLVYDSLGLAHYLLERYEEAIENFKLAIELNPDYVVALSSLGEVYRMLGLNEEAIDSHERAVKAARDDPMARYGLAVAYYEVGRFKDAIASYETLIRMKPHFGDAYLRLGCARSLLGHHQKAIAALKRAIEEIDKESDLADAYICLAVSYNILDLHEKSIDACLRAIDIKPNYVEAYYMLAMCYGSAGHLEKAITTCETSVMMKPDFAEAHFELGYVHHHLQHREESIAALKRAIKIRPDFPKAHLLLAVEYVNLGNDEKAVQTVNRMAELAMHDAESMAFTGWAIHLRGLVHMRMSMYREAKSDFLEATPFFQRKDHVGIKEQLKGLYHLASGIADYVEERRDTAKAEIQKAQMVFKETREGLFIRLAELILDNIEMDGEVLRLAKSKDIESLRNTADNIMSKTETMENWRRLLNAGAIGYPRELLRSILAKYTMIRLLLDVIKGKALNEGALIDASETLGPLVDQEQRRCVEGIGILLLRLARCRNFGEVKKKECEILRLTPEFSAIDGSVTIQALKHSSWAIEMTKLLERHIEQTTEIKSHLTDIHEPLTSLSKLKSKQIEVEFTLTDPYLEKKPKKLNADWRMLEHFLWRGKPVHWLEGYLFFPEWQKMSNDLKDARKQFRCRKASCARELGKLGLELEFRGNRKKKADSWELVRHNLLTNITKAENHYKRAEKSFDEEDFPNAKMELLTALKIYPNHLSSQLLLIEYCEKQGFENASGEEIDGILSDSWTSLKQRRDGLNIIHDLYSETEDEDIQIALSEIRNDPAYSGLKSHVPILRKWLAQKTLTEDDKILLELSMVLEDIMVATTERERSEKKEAFCQIPWIQEIMSSNQIWIKSVAVLLYPEIEDGLQATRLQAMARGIHRLRSRQEFERYFKNVLSSIDKAVKGKDELTESSDFARKTHQIRQLTKLERELCQELHRHCPCRSWRFVGYSIGS